MRARWSVTGLTSTLPIASDNIRYRFWPDQHDWLVIPKYIICSNACKSVTTTLVYVGEKWYHSPTPRTRRNYYVFSKMATCSKKWIGWSTSNRLCCTWSDITSYTWTGRRWTDNTDLTLWRKCSSTIMCVSPSVVYHRYAAHNCFSKLLRLFTFLETGRAAYYNVWWI